MKKKTKQRTKKRGTKMTSMERKNNRTKDHNIYSAAVRTSVRHKIKS